MVILRLLTIWIVSLSFLAPATSSLAQTDAAVEASVDGGETAQAISNVFLQSDLRQAIEDIAAQAGVNIIADPSVQGVVSATLEDASVEEALDLLLAGTEYQWAEFPNYYLVYSADPSNEAFTSVARTQVVRVHYVPAETARNLLPNALQQYVRVDSASDTLAITAPQGITDRIMRDLASIDMPAIDDVMMVPLDYVRAGTAVSLLPEALQRFVRADTERNTLAISAPYGTREVILDHIARLDQPRGPGSFDIPDVYPTQVVKLDYATAEATLGLLPPSLQNYVRADVASNTLAVSAPDVLVGNILADIEAIDTPRKHIMLDARVVVLERSDLLDFGADWQWPTINAGTVVSDAVKWPWELRIGYSPDREFTNALSLTLNLLSANGEASVIASPQVLAQDGREAEIRVTTEEYFQITADAGTFIRADLEKIETGTILGITPQIGPNGELTLNMNIEVSDVVARGERGLPVINRRTARSTIQLENGGTAAVAGLADTSSRVDRSGVPGAQNVPLLGRAFRTDSLNHQARQVAVFVTATIVDDGDAEFETGRKAPPPKQVLDEDLYRVELEAALNRLQARPTK